MLATASPTTSPLSSLSGSTPPTSRSRWLRHSFGASLLAATLLLGACGSDEGEPPGETAPSAEEPSSSVAETTPKTKTDDDAADPYVGLSEADALALASENGVPARVVSRDGEDLAITLDLNPERVNLTIVDDVVTEATLG